MTIRAYRPSNGTEGEIFQERYCSRCIHEGEEDGEYCHILTSAMIFEIDDPEYPKEWVQDESGKPMCLAFTTEKAPRREPDLPGQMYLFEGSKP